MTKPITQILDSLRSSYEKKYGEVIFEIKTNLINNDLLLIQGFVLLPQQKEDIKNVITSLFKGKIKNKVIVLTDKKTKRSLGWGKVNKIVNVYRSPFKQGEEKEARLRKNLSTQVTDQDPAFAILWQLSSRWMLVRLIDNTIGWVLVKKISIKSRPGRISKYYLPKTFSKKVSPIKDKSSFQVMCDSFLEIPYVLGGTGKEGIDCSGLTQRLFKSVYNVVIPKKSIDQMNALKILPVKKENFKWGTLLFMQRKNKSKTWHVGICYDEKEPLIMHSCLKNKKVKLESLSSIKEHYFLVNIGTL